MLEDSLSVSSSIRNIEQSYIDRINKFERISVRSTSDADVCYDFENVSSGTRQTPSFWSNLSLCADYRIIILGQVFSIAFTMAGAAQSTLSLLCRQFSAAPTFMLTLVYGGLALFLIPLYREKNPEQKELLQDDDQSKDSPCKADPSFPVAATQEQLVGSTSTTSKQSVAFYGKASYQRSRSVSVTSQQSATNTMGGLLKKSPMGHSFAGFLILSGSPWVYFMIALIDVSASYATVVAYRYTTITSVALLSSLSVPSTLVLSRTFLKRRYTHLHLWGIALCLVGILMNVYNDSYDEGGDGAVREEVSTTARSSSTTSLYPQKLLGDLLAVLAGFLYGVNNVFGEVSVQKLGGPLEYLGMVGLFGTLICLFQVFFLERDAVMRLFDTAEASAVSDDEDNDICDFVTAWTLVLAYAGCSGAAYYSGARFLQISEASFYSLSLQTGGFWSAVFLIGAQGILPPGMFWWALLLTMSGVCIYEMAPTPFRRTSFRLPNGNLCT